MSIISAGIINCTQLGERQVVCNGKTFSLPEEDHAGSVRFWIDVSVVIGLVLMAGLMSGLTMGLMSMDKLNLKIMQNGQDEKQKKWANKILPLVERHHLLLVTLLLANAVCAEALPIFLDRLVHPAVAIAVSVSLVLLCGEIIPQAVCTRFGLQIGANLAWLVWIMIILLLPVAWPIAKLLDLLLGKETGTFFRRAELKELVHLHAEDVHDVTLPEGESLTTDEVRIIKGAIDMKEKTVEQAFTDIDKVYAIDIDDNLSRDILQQIVDSGHDRIPVYHRTRDHFIGMILVKDLVLIDPNANVPVRNIKLYRVPIVGCDMPLYDMLHQFQTGRSHMAIVLDQNDHITPKGIITLEDVMEELLQEEIFDEDDWRRQQTYHDVRIAKAFMPRKHSLASAPRKQSFFVGGGIGGGPNSQGQLPYPHAPYPAPPGYLPQAPSHIRQRSMSHVPSHSINLGGSTHSLVRPPAYVSPPNAQSHVQAGGGSTGILVGGGGVLGTGQAGAPPVVHPPAHINNPSEQTPLLPSSGKSAS